MTKADHIAGVVAEKDAEIARLNARAEKAEAERDALRRLVRWCRPRLKKESYQRGLDDMLANPREPDSTPVIQSELAADTIEAATIERCALAIECSHDAYSGDCKIFYAKIIRALAKPAKDPA
jgi:hypothetical protein